MRPLRALEAAAFARWSFHALRKACSIRDLRRALSESRDGRHQPRFECQRLLQPVRELGTVARDAGALFLVDAAQTAGCVEIHMEDDKSISSPLPGTRRCTGPREREALSSASGCRWIACAPSYTEGPAVVPNSKRSRSSRPTVMRAAAKPIGIAGLGEGCDS